MTFAQPSPRIPSTTVLLVLGLALAAACDGDNGSTTPDFNAHRK